MILLLRRLVVTAVSAAETADIWRRDGRSVEPRRLWSSAPSPGGFVRAGGRRLIWGNLEFTWSSVPGVRYDGAQGPDERSVAADRFRDDYRVDTVEARATLPVGAIQIERIPAAQDLSDRTAKVPPASRRGCAFDSRARQALSDRVIRVEAETRLFLRQGINHPASRTDEASTPCCSHAAVTDATRQIR